MSSAKNTKRILKKVEGRVLGLRRKKKQMLILLEDKMIFHKSKRTKMRPLIMLGNI
jgi:hypothetical protein